MEDTVSLLLDAKRMDDTDRKILDYCQQALKKSGHRTENVLCRMTLNPSEDLTSDSLEGVLGMAILSVGKLINLCSFLYERYAYSRKDRDAMDELEILGSERLPAYSQTILHDLFELTAMYYAPDKMIIMQLWQELSDARDIAQRYRPLAPNFTLEDGGRLLELAEYAYTGLPENGAFYAPLSRQEIPVCLKECTMYQERYGLLDLKGSLKAVFAKNDGKIYIGFAGTEVWNKIPTLGADIQQLVSPCLMYLRAAGIVAAFMQKYSDMEIIVAGHSLGGGLAQMAVLANSASANTKLYGAAFNSAGLSLQSLTIAAGAERLGYASQKITHFRSEYDVVSSAGALVGGIVLLDQATFPYHCISNIKDCFP